MQNDGFGLFLTHSEKAVQIPARLERNSLVMDVRVCAVRAVADDLKPDSDVEVMEESGVAACEKSKADCEKSWKGMKVKEEVIVLEGEFECMNEARIRILKGYLSRELAMLESIPGWHVLPNGIVVHFNPTATHLLDATANFGPEWTSRMTLVKIEDSGGQWEQLESEESYRDIENPFRPLSENGRSKKALTFVAPARIKDHFIENSEVPISQYPLLDGEVAAWPDDDEDEVEGGEIPVLAAEGGAPAEMREDVEFQDPSEIEVQIDETLLTMSSKMKDLQEMCSKLNLPTSGDKTKVLKRLQKYKHNEEERLALEVAQRLYAESRREPISIKTPKLPTKHEQEIHALTHIPFADWCQSCVATRSREDVRKEDDRSDKKDRGKNLISFDFVFSFTEGEDEERQWGTALYVADSETKAVLCIPVVAKGSASLKQVTEELMRFSMAVGGTQGVIFQSDPERSTRQILRAVQHARAQLGMNTETRVSGVGQHASVGQAERTVQSVRRLANTLRALAEQKAGFKITGSAHCYPWSFRHAAWLLTRYRMINGNTSYESMTGRRYEGKVVLWGEVVLFKDVSEIHEAQGRTSLQKRHLGW